VISGQWVVGYVSVRQFVSGSVRCGSLDQVVQMDGLIICSWRTQKQHTCILIIHYMYNSSTVLS